MWRAFRIQSPNTQNTKTRVLLANHAIRCTRISDALLRMPKIWEPNTSTTDKSHKNCITMNLYTLGD